MNQLQKRNRTTQTIDRIAIFGRPGSGKSVFAKSLSKLLDIPLYHLDCYYFDTNWTVRDKAEFMAWQQKLVQQNKWIVDGNNLDSLEIRYARADVVIYLNRSRWLCYWRILKRRLFSGEDTSDRPANCSEKIAWILLTYMWKYEYTVNKYLHYLRDKYPNVQLYTVKKSADLESITKRLV